MGSRHQPRERPERPRGSPPARRFGFGRRQARRDLDDEIRFHLETARRDLVEQGLEREEAMAEARRRFGNLQRHRETCRRIDRRRDRTLRREELMNDLGLDLRFAWRNLRRSPGFLVVAVLTLAIGMAANAVVYTMIYAMLLKPLPYDDPGELMSVWDAVPARGVEMNAVSAPNWADWRRMNSTFEDLATHTGADMSLTGLDRPERLYGYRASANLFEVLGVEAAHGRTFLPADDEPGATPVTVLSHRVWQTRFGADPGIVGRSILVDDVETTVVGVMPEGFEYPQFQFRGDLWVPIRLTPEQQTEGRGSHYLAVVGRLREGVGEEQAQADLHRVTERLEQEYPGTNTDRRANVIPLQELAAGPMRPAMGVLLATVGFVLLICCANVANLFLARGSARATEIAVRAALGAGRGRLVRQLMTEGLAIAFAGGLVGYAISRVLVGALAASLPDFVRRVAPSSLADGPQLGVFLFTLAVAGFTAVVFALLPAMRASRVDLQDALRGVASGVAGAGGRSRLRTLLVVGEVAISVVLVVGAGLMVRGFVGLVRSDPGFRAEGALSVPLVLPEARYGSAREIRGFFDELLERVRALPGVEQAGATHVLPLTFSDSSSSFLLEGRPEPEPGRFPVARRRQVTEGYVEAMGIPLVTGRSITERDDASATPAVLVNQTFVERHLPDGSPIGQRLRLGGDTTWWEIVGVVGGVRHDALDISRVEPTVYFPFQQLPYERMTLVVRTSGDPAALALPVSAQVWTIDPDLPVGEIQTLEEVVHTALFLHRMPAVMMAGFAAVTLVLAAIGMYGVLAYLVAQRRHEIGVRVALGAERGRVVGLVVRRGLLLAVLGIAVGSLGGFGVGQVLAAVLQNVDGGDLTVYFGVPVVLLLVTLLASWVPARRAARVDPLLALRSE